MSTLADGCVTQGGRVTVWARGGGLRGKQLREASPRLGVRVVPLSGRSWRRLGERHWMRGVQAACADGCPDFVVASSMDVLPGLVAGLPSYTTVGCFAHGRDITGKLVPHRERDRVRALALPGVRWLCLSEWMASELRSRSVPGFSISVVPAAVPIAPPSAPRSGRARNLLTVGRLIPRKGHDVLLSVWPELLRRFPDLRWTIAGDGPQRESLRARIVQAGLADSVRLLGYVSDEEMDHLWAETDLFVMPCREEAGGDTEGFGLVFLEAAARGVPCVGGRTAGATEAVVSVGGTLVEDPTSRASLLGALLPLLSDACALRVRGEDSARRYQEGRRPEHLAMGVLAAMSQDVTT